MTIHLDHTIVPSKNKERAAKFFAKIFGLTYAGLVGHFAPVKVDDWLTMDFDNMENFGYLHYAFKVDEETFEEIMNRVKDENIEIGDAPFERNMKIYEGDGRKSFYFYDPDGHNLEVITSTVNL